MAVEPIAVLDAACWPEFPAEPPADGLAGTEPKPGVHQWARAAVYEVDPITLERGQLLYEDAAVCVECGKALEAETFGTRCLGEPEEAS